MDHLQLNLAKDIVIKIFKIKIKHVKKLIDKPYFKSEALLLSVCYLDYLSHFFVQGQKGSKRFCHLLIDHGKNSLIWGAFYPQLYDKETSKLKKNKIIIDKEFISYHDAKKYINDADLFKGTLSYFLYREVRCIAVHHQFCSASGKIRIPVIFKIEGLLGSINFIGDTLLNQERSLTVEDLFEELNYLINKLELIESNNFIKFIQNVDDF